jgi:uncharacterized protein (DUF2249 family)
VAQGGLEQSSKSKKIAEEFYLWRVKITKKDSTRTKEQRAELPGNASELDVRKYAPAERHRLIFEAYEALKPEMLLSS